MKRWLLLFGMAGLAGCARFEPRPLAPDQTAVQWESRRLDDAGLRAFIEQGLGRPLPAWPLPDWDLTTLSLAAFYYQPSLEVARAQWAVAQAGIKTAGGRPNPTLSLTPGYDTTATTISPWLPLINLDWPLETAGKRAKRIATARDAAASARWDIITAAWSVRSSVRNTLLDLQMAEQRAKIIDQQYAWQSELGKRLQQRSEVGDLARPDVLTAKIALHKIAQDQLDARLKISDARARLAGALGLSTAALDGITIHSELFRQPVPNLTLAAARTSALRGRSDILGALADYAAAEDDLRLEIAKQYPDVHVNPGYQYNQGDNQWMLGISMELPVLNQNQGPIAEAEARRQLAAAKFRARQAQVISEVEQALAGYQLAEKQLSSSQSLLNDEREQQKSLAAQKQAGAADQFDLLGAQLELAGTQLAQLDILDQEQRARGALEDALQYPLDDFKPAVFQHLSDAPVKKEPHP